MKKKEESEFYISIGSNIGDSVRFIKKSVFFLNSINFLSIRKHSNIHRTRAVDFHDQPDFYNMILKIVTKLSPFQLMNLLQYVESIYYKKKYIYSYMPRKLDLDIIICNTYDTKNEKVFLPHKCMFKRKFIKNILYELNK